MNNKSGYPGTIQHQALLKCIVDYYQNDPRILAVIIFGSIGRGNWDAYSDIDLDVITNDDASVNVIDELHRLSEAFSALNEKVAFIIPDKDDAGDIVLESLMMLSIRYHSLADTSPNITESMQLLSSNLDKKIITIAGNANSPNYLIPLSQLLDQCVRYMVVANASYKRKQTWGTVEDLHRISNLLMEIFARTHGRQRGYQAFGELAEKRIQERFGATLPQYDNYVLRESLVMTLNVMKDDLEYLTNGQIELTDAQKNILDRVHQAIASDNVGV